MKKILKLYAWYTITLLFSQPLFSGNYFGKLTHEENFFNEQLEVADNGEGEDQVDAQYEVAKCYGEGIGIEKDDKKAVEYYEKATINKHIQAPFYLGKYYLAGLGTEQSVDHAIIYFKKGDLQAESDIWILLCNLFQAPKKSQEIFKKLCEYKKNSAQWKFNFIGRYFMSLCYLNGVGVEQSDKNAMLLNQDLSITELDKQAFKTVFKYVVG